MIETVTDAATVGRAYDELLATSFRAPELVSRDELIAAAAQGTSDVLVERDGTSLDGVAVGERYGSTTLLAYLAVGAERRSSGVGGRLLDTAVQRWSAERGNILVLAEIERPDRHGSDPRFGDPARRVDFYARHGARALALPYFQPALSPSLPREHGLLLIVLAAAEGALGLDGERLEAAASVLEFLVSTIGAPRPADAAATALFRALEGPVAVLPLSRYAEIPASVPE